MIVPVLGGRNGNNTQSNTQSSGVVPVLQGRSNIVPVHTQVSALSIPKQQPQQNFLQQSGNFLNGVYKGAVGEVGSILNSQPVKNTEKTASKVINGITVKFVKPTLNTPVGKEVKDFYDVTTQNPNYEKPSGTGIGDLVARGIQNPQVAGAEGVAVKGFSKAGALIGGAVNAGLGYLANKNNNIPTTSQDVLKNVAVGALLGGAGGHVGEKQVKPKVQDILTSGTHKPEDLVGAVMKHNLENTPEGKKVIQLAHQAQQQGQHIAIDNPFSDFNKNVEDYRSYGGYTAGKSTPNAALRDIEKVADTPQIKKYTQQQVQEAIKSGELKPNKDGTITLYRGGKPSSQNGLVSASYDKSVAENFAKGGELHGIQVKPEEIKAFIGKQEKEVLIDKSAIAPQETKVTSVKDAKSQVAEQQRQAKVEELTNKGSETKTQRVLTTNQVKGIRQTIKDRINEVNRTALTPEEYAKGIDKMSTDIQVMGKGDKEVLSALRTEINREMYSLVGVAENTNYKEAYRTLESVKKTDTINGPLIEKLESIKNDLDNKLLTAKTVDGSTHSQATTEKTLTPVGTGETKQSTLGRKVEAKAIENKLLKNGIDKLPEYQKASMKEQGKLASDYLASNEKEAIDVALGKKSAPDGIIPEAIYTAVENKAIADKNVSLLANLAKSSRVGEATAMGQRIRALGERNPDSPVKNITDLLNRRIKSVEDRTSKPIEKLREEEVSKIKKVQGEQKKPDKYDWNNFINSIQC